VNGRGKSLQTLRTIKYSAFMYLLLIIPMKMIILQEGPYPISEETEFLCDKVLWNLYFHFKP